MKVLCRVESFISHRVSCREHMHSNLIYDSYKSTLNEFLINAIMFCAFSYQVFLLHMVSFLEIPFMSILIEFVTFPSLLITFQHFFLSYHFQIEQKIFDIKVSDLTNEL